MFIDNGKEVHKVPAEEEMPDIQDKEVQAVTKKIQFAFRSKKSPKPKVPDSPSAVPVSVPAVPLPVSVPATAVLLKLADEKSSSPEKSERISEAKSVSSQKSSSTEEKSSADRSTAESEKSSIDRSTADKSSARSSADRSTADRSTADRSTAEKQSIGEDEEMPDLQDKDVQRVTQKMQFAFRSKKSPQPPAEAIIKTDKEETKISFPREYPLEEKIALEKSYSKENIAGE